MVMRILLGRFWTAGASTRIVTGDEQCNAFSNARVPSDLFPTSHVPGTYRYFHPLAMPADYRKMEICRDRSFGCFSIFNNGRGVAFFFQFLMFLDRTGNASDCNSDGGGAVAVWLSSHDLLSRIAMSCRVMGEINYLAVDRYLHHTGVTVSSLLLYI